MQWNEQLIKDFVHYYNTVGGDLNEIMDEFRRLKGIGGTPPMHNVDYNGNVIKEIPIEEMAMHMVVPPKIMESVVSNIRNDNPYKEDILSDIVEHQAKYMIALAKELHSKLYQK